MPFRLKHRLGGVADGRPATFGRHQVKFDTSGWNNPGHYPAWLPAYLTQLIDRDSSAAGQPRRVGGSELPWVALIDIGSTLARGCGSTAWNWANYAVHHWMLAFWPVECQDEIWDADPAVLIASSVVFPAGKATRVAGGYRLSGRWPFSSGVDPSAWNMLGGIVQADGATGDYRIFLLPRDDYTIIDNWHVMGLRGTGSKDVQANDVFVPEHRTLAVETTKGGDNHPGAAVNRAPLFRIPIFATFPYMLTGIALGIAEGAYENVVDGLRGRVARYWSR